jgi:hypothetical protein
MAPKNFIAHQLLTEIRREHKLPRLLILQIISESVDEIIKKYEQRPATYTPAIAEALDKIKTVTVTRGDPMPAYQLEALKELIKRVALRKIRQLEEYQLEKQRPKAAAHGKRRRQKSN